MRSEEELSKDAARKFLVHRQFFLQEKGKDGTLKAVKNLECVQRDPISVIHCNQHLVLHNRVTDYSPRYLEELLYKDRLLFEYWCNEKSVIPIEDFPYFRYRMRNPSQFHSPFYERIKRRRQELKDHLSLVLSEIRKQGPLSSRELKQSGRVGGRMATSVLNLLWDFGELMIHHEEGNRRYFDLTEHVLPSNVDSWTPTKEEFEQFMVEKYIRAHGLADTRNWRFGWLPLKAFQRKAIVEEMVKEGKLIPVRIEGVKHVYHVIKGHFSFLKSPDQAGKDRVYFIAPLDNLIWNRKAILEIFDFSYSWEVYKVPDRRIYGYYVMPILFDSRFVGRLDPKLDRKNSMLIINSIWLEKDKLDMETFLEAFSATLKRFLRFHNVSRFTIKRSEPRAFRKDLITKLKH